MRYLMRLLNLPFFNDYQTNKINLFKRSRKISFLLFKLRYAYYYFFFTYALIYYLMEPGFLMLNKYAFLYHPQNRLLFCYVTVFFSYYAVHKCVFGANTFSVTLFQHMLTIVVIIVRKKNNFFVFFFFFMISFVFFYKAFSDIVNIFFFFG